MTDTDLTLRGVAIRGARLAETPELAGGVTLPTAPVTLRSIRDELLGEARLSWLDGDILVDATVRADQLTKLVGSPHLCVAIRVNEDEDDASAVVGFVAVCASVTDPFQLPYRVTGVPGAWREWLERYGYRSVRVVDEPHDVEVDHDLNTDEVHMRFDEAKSHVEWRHQSESRQRALPDAVARGFGHETWAALVGEERGNLTLGESESAVVITAREVLDQVIRLGHA